jgi:hypothetical protein
MDEENKKTKEKERLLKPIRAGVEELDRKLKNVHINQRSSRNLLQF